jgi:hypothetical protein
MDRIVANWKEFFWKGNQKEQSANRATNDALNDEIAKIWGIKETKEELRRARLGFGSRKTESVLVDLSSKRVTITKSLLDGKRDSFELNQDRALYLWLALSQPQLKDNMLKNGWDEQTMKELVEALPQNVLELGRYMQRNLDLEYDKINPIYQSLFGANMPRNLQYFPFRPDVKNRSKEEAESFNQGLIDANAMLKPGAIIARVKHNLRIDLTQGATSMFLHHKMQMNRFKTYALGSKDFFAVMGNSAVARSVRTAFGDTFYDQLMQHASETVSGGNRAFIRRDLLVRMKGLFVYKALSGNVGVFFKQLVSFPAYYINMTNKQFFSTLATSWTPAAFKDYQTLINTEFVQNRWNSGNHIEALFILQQAQKRGFVGKMARAGMITTRLGDLAPILVMGRGVYNQAFAEAKRKGLSDVAAAEHAEFVFGSMTEQSQQSSAWKDRTGFQRESTWGEVSSMFQTSPRQYFALATRAIQRAAGRRTPKEIRKMMEVSVITFGILPASFLFVSNLFKFDILGRDDDRDEEEVFREYAAIMANSVFSGMWMIRYVTEEVVNRIVKGKADFFPSDIPITSLDKEITNIYEIVEALFLLPSGDKEISDVLNELGQSLPVVKQATELTKERILD